MSLRSASAARTPAGPSASKLVAVVVPLSDRAERSPEEETSLRHLRHHLARYDRFVIAPERLSVDYPDFDVVRFPPRFFGSLRAHNRLLLSRGFYESFRDYKFILTYHLDALVFSDELLDWCSRDLDYIAPPWWHAGDERFIIGNGGFALRKVDSFLRVLTSREYAVDPDDYWRRKVAGKSVLGRLANLPKKYAKRMVFFNGIRPALAEAWRTGYAEDAFISEHALRFYPAFKFAPLDLALRFGFDNAPSRCAELTGGVLPFGCHAWHKWEPWFWEPYLLRGSP